MKLKGLYEGSVLISNLHDRNINLSTAVSVYWKKSSFLLFLVTAYLLSKQLLLFKATLQLEIVFSELHNLIPM